MGVLKVKDGGIWVPLTSRGDGGQIPAGGTPSQVLTKTGPADYAAGWTTPGVGLDSSAGTARGGYVADTGWHELGAPGEPTLQNGWLNYTGAATWDTAAFRINSEGWVFLKGLIQSGTAGPIFTLPVGYRPMRTIFCPALSWNGQVAYIVINTDGTVTYSLGTGTNQWLMLSNVRFPAWNTWSQFSGRYFPLEGIEMRATITELLTGLFPQPNGMTRITGISGAVATAGQISDLNNLGEHIMSYVFGVATADSAGARCFQISKRYGFHFNGPNPASTWTMFSSEFGTIRCEDQWIAPTLINGWANYGPNTGGWYTPAGYWKDNDGVVHLRGFIQGGSAFNANMFVLPVGYRPPKNMMWYAGSALATQQCRVDVQSDGVVRCNTGGSTTWTSLDGINFYEASA